MTFMSVGLLRRSSSSHIWSIRNLQVIVDVVVVSMLMSPMLVAVRFSMTAAGRMEEEGEHTQEAELGVHVDSHCPLSSWSP